MTATLSSDKAVFDSTCPVHGRPLAVTPAHNAWPLNEAEVIWIAPVFVIDPTRLAVQPTALPDFVSVVAPAKLIEPAGETVTAKADAETMTDNANAAPTGMRLKRFMSKTSHQSDGRME
ncbi:MAG: hypothetical protein EPN57_02810 [Paraburkholderia sp.]|nr:MAG: hypothetical protein EPN57_02810 [Paraburkholderia sp.]